MASVSHKRYNKNIPVVIHNRPTEVVKHIMHRNRSSSNVDADDISRKGNLFCVKSAFTTEPYVLSFWGCNIFPKCSCCDFKKYFLPCKHMFAIFNKFSDVSWANLPEWYHESPIIILDSEIVRNKTESLTLLESIVESTHEAPAAREDGIVASDVNSNNISTASSVARGGRGGGSSPPHWLVKYAKSHVFCAFEADFLRKMENSPPPFENSPPSND